MVLWFFIGISKVVACICFCISFCGSGQVRGKLPNCLNDHLHCPFFVQGLQLLIFYKSFKVNRQKYIFNSPVHLHLQELIFILFMVYLIAAIALKATDV